MNPFERLLELIRGNPTWPPKGQGEIWRQIELWAAFRRSDEVRLKQEASIPWHRRLLNSPVPRLISRAKANLLYGEEPEVQSATEADQAALENIIDENGLPAELHRAAMVASSERETWGRISVDPTLLDVPILEFWSRRRVIPHFRGRFVAGATFVTEWPISSWTVVRLLETYEAGAVHSRLYRGSRTSLGSEMPLDSFDETRGRQPTVLTGFDYPLVAFIPNSVDDPPTLGYSDYQGLEERFLAITESATIGQENFRLAGQKAALIDAKYLRNGRLPTGRNVYVRSEDSATAGDPGKPLQMLEFDPGVDATNGWLDAVIDATLNMGGTAPELVGRHQDTGQAISGTALKLKMVHSLMEAAGTGAFFDRGVTRLLRAAAIIDARPTFEGGFGRNWRQPDADPSITRGDGLPRDEQEAAQWVVLAAGADAISVEERVRYLHPDWPQDQIDQEVKRIKDQKKAAVTAMPQIPANRPPVGDPQLPPGDGAQGNGAGQPAGAGAAQ